MKIDRLLGILNILVSTERVTVQELAERFEVSKRTVFRDLDTLNKSGIPIVTYSGIGGGVSVVEGYKYKKSVLSKNDIKNIFTALSGFMSINRDNDLINLMAKVIPEETSTIFSESDYLIDLSSWFKDSITQEKISDLREAIKNHKCISLEYISKSSRKIRIIHPYKLVFKQSYWYLYSFCEDSNGFRLFKINRIASYTILDKNFECKPIEKIDLKNDFSSALFNTEGSKTIYNVTLEYDRVNEFLLTEKIDAKFFKRDGYEEKGYIIFQVSDLDWTAGLVISLMDKVKVISPAQLKEKVKLQIKNMREFYKDDI
ncbi:MULTISPECIES: helix-turn-helix transcriptional regulator [unclassified Clostridium]|uniref:helix-turn-helix transcriptional regulator n=1 Tax=unclassified Clostridium TaxID=2614128 RepID=UPI0025BF78EA|nr:MULTISPECIES: YafY family protein [unclassified Clostridium]